jgi:hypothetical protein
MIPRRRKYVRSIDFCSHCKKFLLDPYFWINRWSEAQQEIEPSHETAPQDLVYQRFQKMAIVATDFVHVAEHYGKYVSDCSASELA